jgi:hypothetical protein
VAVCKDLLKPGGQIGAFYTQVITPDEPRETLQAERTKLARALAGQRLEYRTWEFSEDERRHWRLSLKIAEALKSEFEREDNQELYEGRIKESQQLLQAVDDDRISRYLYHVQI